MRESDEMTIIRGVRIVAAPCCGARYAAPRYVSMNFMAFEYWTDGWRDGSLMPNDEGLRRCKCGRFVLMRDLVPFYRARLESGPQENCFYTVWTNCGPSPCFHIVDSRVFAST